MSLIVLDTLLLGMLASTLAWCVALYRRLGRAAAARADLEATVASLDEAVKRAEAALRNLRQMGLANAEALSLGGDPEGRIGDLDRLVSAGARVTERLEEALTRSYAALAEQRTREMAPAPVRRAAKATRAAVERRRSPAPDALVAAV